MKVNYGINRIVRKNGRRHTEHVNGVLNFRRDDVPYREVMDKIKKRHPNWSVTGFCRALPPKGVSDADVP